MENILMIDSVETFNRVYGLETRHPLVTVADLSQQPSIPGTALSTMAFMPCF